MHDDDLQSLCEVFGQLQPLQPSREREISGRQQHSLSAEAVAGPDSYHMQKSKPLSGQMIDSMHVLVGHCLVLMFAQKVSLQRL